jgi:SAM-dependent methyltransferase
VDRRALLSSESNWGDLAYSLRRHWVDEFLARELAALPDSARLLDVGGYRVAHKGRLDPGALKLTRVTANLAPEKRPHVLADALSLPFAPASFDAVLVSEVLEHLADARAALAQIARVLKPGGRLLITVPFLYPIHADPHDHERCTDVEWRARLAATGFAVTSIEAQGRCWTVLADALRVVANEGIVGMGLGTRIRRRLLAGLVRMLRPRAVRWDASSEVERNRALAAYTTGWGIVAVRA